MELKDILIQAFTDDPVNWVKWVVVFLVLILGYVISIPVFGKVRYFLSWERKRDIAKGKGHEIKATLVREYPSGEVGNYTWHATYEYEWNGEVKKYKAIFNSPGRPQRILYLYYMDNPKKVFSVEEYHWENHKGLILLPIMAFPWILAALTLVLLKVDISGFM